MERQQFLQALCGVAEDAAGRRHSNPFPISYLASQSEYRRGPLHGGEVRGKFLGMQRFLFCCTLCAPAGFGAANYTSMTLGPTPDQPTAIAVPTGLNNAGQVAGYEYTTSNTEPTLVVWNVWLRSYRFPLGIRWRCPLRCTI